MGQGMTSAKIVEVMLVASFGLWWLLFPASVIRFYTWLHRGKFIALRPIGVRLVGAIWILLVVAGYWAVFRE